jgi:hypothetical protein
MRRLHGERSNCWQEFSIGFDVSGFIVDVVGCHSTSCALMLRMCCLQELNIEDRLQWKEHSMIFAMPDSPGEFSR